MADKKKILLIDNEKDFCFFLKMNLEETGDFQVTTATSGKEGLRLIKNNPPDLILLDIVMPEMSGAEVAEKLLNDTNTKKIPIIFLTGVVTGDDVGVESIKEIGGNSFITKTAGSQEIINSIEKALET